MTEWLAWLEQSDIGYIARQSLWGFQILVGVHIVGLIFSVGMLLWVDLRMLGLWGTERSLDEIYRVLSRWFAAGFVVMLGSGLLLFAGFASSAYGNVWFRIKLAVIVLAGINAVAFHRLNGRLPAAAGHGAPPGAVRLAGLLSLVFWAAVIICGRVIAYTLY